MKLINSRRFGAGLSLAFFLLLLIFSPAQVFAQEENGPQGQADARQQNPEGDLVRQLNLTPDQIEKIKAIREQNRDTRRQIGMRVRAARVALDRAIYVENADEAVVEQRARDLAEAQAAQVRLQAMTELGVRRILTPEQIQTFRTLRMQAERQRRNRRLQENANRSQENRQLAPLRRGQNAPGQVDNGQGLSPRQQRRPRP